MKYSDTWLYSSNYVLGTYVHFSEDGIDINRHPITDNESTAYMVKFERLPHKKYPLYKFSYVLQFDDYDYYHQFFDTAIEELFNKMKPNLPENTVIIFASKTTDRETIEVYDNIIKRSEKILSVDDFKKLKIPTGEGYKFYGMVNDEKLYRKIKKVGLLEKIKKMFR